MSQDGFETEAQIRTLNALLAPPQGDVVVSVESQDQELLRELWTLQGEGVEINQTIKKAGNDPGTVYIILKDIAAGLTAVSLALNVIKNVFDLVNMHTKGGKKAKIKVRAKKNKDEIEKLIEIHGITVEAEITGESGDKYDGKDT